MSRHRVVCYGDSITQRGHDIDTGGWLSVIQSNYCRAVDIVNRGYSGYNTDWLLEHFDDLKSDFDGARLIFILMGANDSASDVQHVPIDRFKSNIIQLVNRCKEAGGGNVVLITTPWVDGDAWKTFSEDGTTSSNKEPNRNEHTARKYSIAGKPDQTLTTVAYNDYNLVSEAAQELNIDSIPLFDAMFNFGTDRSSLLCDGLHLSAIGNRLLVDLVDPYLSVIGQDQCPDWKVKAKL